MFAFGSFSIAAFVFCFRILAQPGPSAEKADSILILKKEHKMELLAKGKVIRTYTVALGRGGLAPKEREGG